MTSVRAQEVAEILWELKRADKIATYSLIAKRAGFGAGSNGRTIATCLKTVRRDWPHLQWWRAVRDDGVLNSGSEHEERLREFGVEFEEVDGEDDLVAVSSLEEHLMSWEEE